MNSIGFFPSFPSVSTAKVTSLLRNKGIPATNYDLNLATWSELLSTDFIASCKYRREMIQDTQVPFPLTMNEKKYQVLKDNVIGHIDFAKAIFKSSTDFYDHDKLTWAVNVLFQAQQVIYYHYGCFITNKVIFWPHVGFNLNNLDTIYKLSIDRDHNPFISLYEKVLEPVLLDKKPTVIGIDIAFPWEVLPILTMNRLIKKTLPSVHLNFTGHGFDELNFSRVAHRLQGNQKLFFGFDSIFLARNDSSLQRFYSQDPNDITDIDTFNSLAIKKQNSTLVSSSTCENLKEEEIFPDYSDLHLSQYYTPHLVLIDKMSNKCYWNKCAFCNINMYKKDASRIQPGLFVDRLTRYNSVYEARHFFLLDEAIDPEYVSAFCDILLAKKTAFTWSIRTRIDEGYSSSLLKKMYDAGCRELWVGMENASPGLLKAMNKCADPQSYINQIQQLMRDCNELGIGLHFCLLFGFPTETDEDRHINIHFFKKMRKYLKRMPFFTTFNIFNLNYGTDVFRNPSKYNVVKIDYNDSDFNMMNIPYSTNNGNDVTSPGYVRKIDSLADDLTNIFVPSQVNHLLWFVMSDSPWELLYKEHYAGIGKNPFQRGGGFLETMLIKLYFILESNSLALKVLNFMSNKKIVSTKAQVYR